MILTKIHQRIFLFETKNNFVTKQHITYNFRIYLENLTSRISTSCSGRYKQVIKSLGHLSGRWSRCRGGRYIEMFDLKT